MVWARLAGWHSFSQSVIDERLTSGNDAIRVAKIRAALGAIALGVYPATGFSAATALDTLAHWQGLPAVVERFEPEPAETLLEAIRRAASSTPKMGSWSSFTR